MKRQVLSEVQMKLRPGDPVAVVQDDGMTVLSTVTIAPWQLGHGHWVLGYQGRAGGYSLDRCRPVSQESWEAMRQGPRVANFQITTKLNEEEVERLIKRLAEVRGQGAWIVNSSDDELAAWCAGVRGALSQLYPVTKDGPNRRETGAVHRGCYGSSEGYTAGADEVVAAVDAMMEAHMDELSQDDSPAGGL